MYTCAEMTSSEIANLQQVVDAKKNKTFYTVKRIFKQWSSTNPPISTKGTIVSHLKSLNLSKNCLLQFSPIFIKSYSVFVTIFPHIYQAL